MRQRLGIKKVNRLRLKFNLDIVAVLVRGGTNHRRDLVMRDGSMIYLFSDGTMASNRTRFYSTTYGVTNEQLAQLH